MGSYQMIILRSRVNRCDKGTKKAKLRVVLAKPRMLCINMTMWTPGDS